METVDNREKIKILEAGETANKETIKEQEKKLKDTLKEKQKLEKKIENILAKLDLGEGEEQDITDFTDKLEKLMAENEELENKLEVS